MATVNDWNKHMNVLHVLALIEDDLRTTAVVGDPGAAIYASALLAVHF